MLFDFDPALDPVAFPTPRSWEFAHRALQKFDSESVILANAIQACVGNAAGIELSAFIANLTSLGDVDEIIEGRDFPVPDSIDLQYALASSLVGRAVNIVKANPEDARLGNILKYASCFPQREMGVMLVSDMYRAIGEPLFSVPQFADWANQVSEVLLYSDDG